MLLNSLSMTFHKAWMIKNKRDKVFWIEVTSH